MKSKLLLFPAIAALLLCGLAGCSNKEVDTAKLQAAFQSADADTRAEVDKCVADITAKDYAGALPILKHLGYAIKLNQDQRLIVEDSVAKLKAKVQ